MPRCVFKNNATSSWALWRRTSAIRRCEPRSTTRRRTSLFSMEFCGDIADIRNLCVHNKQIEPTASQSDDLLSGVSKAVKTLF